MDASNSSTNSSTDSSTPPNLGGGKTIFKPETVIEIIRRLSLGEPLEAICRSPGMPSSRTIWDWQAGKIAAVPSWVGTEIARARDLGYDAIAERLRSVAAGGEGSTGDVQRDKLVVDTDLKLLAKWSPKRYGDRTIVDNNVNVSLTSLVEQSFKLVEEQTIKTILNHSDDEKTSV